MKDQQVKRSVKFLQCALLLVLLIVILSACSSNVGIFAGGNWQSGGLTHQHIRALAVDPNNLQTIYAGDVDGKVFASTDGGLHWHDRSIGLPGLNTFHALAFDVAGKKLYAATSAGLFVSANAGQQWRTVTSQGSALPMDSYTTIAFDVHTAHTLYVGTVAHGVLVSTDDGNSWTVTRNGLPLDAVINGLSFDTALHQLWAATSRGVFRSDNSGVSWQAFNAGLPTAVNIYAVQPDTLVIGGTNGLVFAGTNHGFFVSQDAGRHWAPSQESLARTSVRTINIDFQKPTTIYIGTDVGVLRSDDSGQNWGGVGPGIPRGQSVYALTWGAINNQQLFAAANDVYLYPGSSSGFSLDRLVFLLFIGILFFVLYRFATRHRRRIPRASAPVTNEPGNEQPVQS